MEARSSKRRRLITISSNVSSWPDVPATFESLNDDTLGLILQFVGRRSYKSFGGLNYHCKEIYIESKMEKETYFYGYAPLSVIRERYERRGRFNQKLYERVGKGVVLYNRRNVLDWALEEQNRGLLFSICNVATRERRIDLLNEVWNYMNDEDDKEWIFRDVDYFAARCGTLNVLKWLVTKRLSIKKDMCADEAAYCGHPHILQWLREEQSLQLTGQLYEYAVDGSHLHVMKWLREQGCPWHIRTFCYAVEKGNLDILQWLHDEGCPWNMYRVFEVDLKPELVEWLRSNGW